MVRAVLRFVFRWIVELFFRRVDVVGVERVPATAPTLFAMNHPNALVDPLLLLCYAPRPVSLLGKEPLLRMPVIGWLARSLDTIPVYRRQDQADVSRNRETFARARELLERGGTIAIAPEGTSHSDPSLRPLKTGAARIALGAGTTEPVRIVPVGLFYSAKMTFRSEALVVFGEPITVPAAPLDVAGEPPAELTETVTGALERGLAAVVLQADAHDALDLAVRTERILAAALPDPKSRTADDIVEVRRRLVEGYATLKQRDPVLLGRLRHRIERLDRAFRIAGLDPTRPVPRPDVSTVLRAIGWLVFRILVFIPLALPGLLIHLPAYWLIGPLAERVTRNTPDVRATAKIIGAAVFYPLTWLVVALVAGKLAGWPIGLAAFLLAPLSGYAALRLVERADRFLSGTRAVGVHLFEREAVTRLVRERERLRADLVALATRLGPGG